MMSIMSESSSLTFLFYYLCAERNKRGVALMTWSVCGLQPHQSRYCAKSWCLYSQFLKLHKIFLWRRNARLPRYSLCMGDFAYLITGHMWEKSSDQWKSGDDKFHIWKISSVVRIQQICFTYPVHINLSTYVFQNSCDGWTRNRNLIINVNAQHNAR